MGLSVSILISAWREIFTQRFHTHLCDISFPSPSPSPSASSSSSRTMQLNLNLIRRGNSFKMIRSSSSSASDPTDYNKTPVNITTTAAAAAASRKGFKSAKPESIMVITKRALLFEDLIIQKHDHLPNTPPPPPPPPPNNNKKVLIEGSNGLIHEPLPAITLPSPAHEFVFSSPRPECVLEAAAVKLQKVYKSYRTRRSLADCAVVVEELWWKALDFAALKRSSISFFDCDKQETAVSKWARARTRVAKVGKGLSKNEKAQKLALRHWLEAIDPRHRYGHNLHLYYDIWFQSESSQPYFYWLDIGDGKEVNLEKCPRTKLQHQCIQYLGPKERESYEVIVEDGKLTYKLSGELVETEGGSKWIFVLSTARALYIGEKRKGSFQHSSFLAGGATTAAGRLVVHGGILEAIWPYSGHYLPTEENFNEFIGFLQENNLDLTDVKKYNYNDESVSVIDEVVEYPFETEDGVRNSSTGRRQRLSSVDPEAGVDRCASGHSDKLAQGEVDDGVPSQRIEAAPNNKPKPLSCKWTTGTGPRIGCVRDYPVNLQSQALEHVKLSPRLGSSEWPIPCGPIPSPRPSPRVRVSPRLSYMGLPSPRRN